MDYIDDSVLILSQLVSNKSYYKKVMAHLDESYFTFELDRRIFKFFKNYSNKYKEAPTPIIVKNALSQLDLTDEAHKQYIDEFIELLNKAEVAPFNPMVDKTEEFIKDIALRIALEESVEIYRGDSKKEKGAIIPMLKTALAVSIEDLNASFFFDEETAIARKKEYSNKESKIKFKNKKMNEVTTHGVMGKSLHTFVAAPNVGKTAFLISIAADYIEMGYDVLYVTCEMSQAQIGIRFDARFLDYETCEIPGLDDDLFLSKISGLKDKSGTLAIKEYSANSLDANKLRTLYDEMETKYSFKPKIVIVDYLGICISYMTNEMKNIGLYYTKVAEEFRAFAQDTDTVLWTAQQMVTEALDNTDPTLKHIGYGQGIAKTSDMIWFGIRTEDLDKAQQLLIKQDKTRYHKERIQRFTIGFDMGRLKIFDVDQPALISVEEENKPQTSIKTAFNMAKNKNANSKQIKV